MVPLYSELALLTTRDFTPTFTHRFWEHLGPPFHLHINNRTVLSTRMRFLPSPQRSMIELARVVNQPWTTPGSAFRGALDGSDFDSYAESHGWPARRPQEWYHNFENDESPPLRSFMQTWLLCGLLSFMFQRQIGLADLIPDADLDNTPGTVYISSYMTRDLFLPIAREIIDNEESSSRTQARRRGWLNVKKIHYAICGPGPFFMKNAHGETQCTLIDFITGFRHSTWPTLDSDLLHLLVLLDFFESLLWPRNGTSTEAVNHARVSKAMRRFEPPGISIHLKGFGLCPSIISRMTARLNAASLMFMTQSAELVETQIYTRSSKHDLCTATHCESSEVRQGSYVRRHFGTEHCVDLVADQQKLLDILVDGQLPIVRLPETTKPMSFEYISSSSESPQHYVAISHVWSDGLGNENKNALYRCQLNAVSKYVKAMPMTDLPVRGFWLDTLCVPRLENGDNAIDLPNFRLAKRKAIESIRSSYEGAVAVLVLDSWLLHMKQHDIPHEETLLKVLNSPWNTRLWTFQEGATARKLYFQFSDGVYDLDLGMQAFNGSQDLFAKHTLGPSIFELYHQLRDFRRGNISYPERLAAVISAVRLRSSTLAADEPLCLAALLNLDLIGLASVPESERVQEFWRIAIRGADYTPLIYQAARMVLPGFRWAPRQLLWEVSQAVPHTNTSDPYSIDDSGEKTLSINATAFNFVTFDGKLKGVTLALEKEDLKSQLPQMYYKIEADLSLRDDVEDRWTAPTLAMDSLFGTVNTAFIAMYDERAQNRPFGSSTHFAREGYIVACGADKEYLTVKHGSEWHKQPLSYSHDHEGMEHEHWMPTAYICPARMTIHPFIRGEETSEHLAEFGATLHGLLNATEEKPYDDPWKPMSTLFGIGSWFHKNWIIT